MREFARTTESQREISIESERRWRARESVRVREHPSERGGRVCNNKVNMISTFLYAGAVLENTQKGV